MPVKASAKKIRTDPAPRALLIWHFVSFEQTFIERTDRGLAIQMAQVGPSFVVIAVEGPRQSTMPDVSALLASHAHALIGTFGSELEAVDAAERFAAQWLSGIEIERCACSEIAPIETKTTKTAKTKATRR